VYREEDIENVIVDTTNYKRPPPGNHYGDISEGQEDLIEEIEEDYALAPEDPVGRNYEDDDMDQESDDDESTEYRPRSKKRVKPHPRASARRFFSALQLEKEQLAREQAKRSKRSRAIDALQVLAAKEIFDAAETVPAIESGRGSSLKDVHAPLRASEVTASRTGTDSHTVNNVLRSGSGTLLEQASRELSTMTSSANVRNIALCKSNDTVMVNQ
jgi:hypothetical protein